MRICAITMVYRDHWALSQWYMHYARHLGAKNLFIVAHGADPMLPRLCPGANILTVPRDRLEGFDALRDRLLNGLLSGLLAVYDWAIRTDADELVCLDPALYDSFESFFAAQTGQAVFALGLNLAERPGDPRVPDGDPVLKHRPAAAFSSHYSKAWAARGDVRLVRHGVQVRPRLVPRFPFVLPPGVYLIHLKYAFRPALLAANHHRREIAGGPGKGLPGPAWAKPLLAARKFYDGFEALPEAPWDPAAEAALATIAAEPARDAKRGLIRARNHRFTSRTTLPERLRGA
ncbi:glycosyltransferase family 2 protein [Pseudodonghicola flavimaris]|uniref:Glycosyltransferase family 2 protein n=1 Tax=Pseudodonghicola flavimaris TaxID=3050036 RepID=A0ABT7EYZ3_9RHOB|nr:glycosyltransferase family 2 protein [Pseudodonghicola flavimaris]MDK3017562.1 glycosyltransferase family 2 protein [Pseudodonghicola flavimaris]